MVGESSTATATGRNDEKAGTAVKINEIPAATGAPFICISPFYTLELALIYSTFSTI